MRRAAEPGPGPWLRCDPRARLLATLVASAVVLAASSWGQICCGLSAVAALHLASGTGPGAALGSLRPFRFLLLFTLVVQAGFTGGTPLLPGLLPGAITIEGSQAAALAMLRLAGVIAASAHLVRTTSPLELARSLGWALDADGAGRGPGARGDAGDGSRVSLLPGASRREPPGARRAGVAGDQHAPPPPAGCARAPCSSGRSRCSSAWSIARRGWRRRWRRGVSPCPAGTPTASPPGGWRARCWWPRASRCRCWRQS